MQTLLRDLPKRLVLILSIYAGHISCLSAQHPYPNFDFSDRNFSSWRLYQGPQSGQGGNRTIRYSEVSTDGAAISGNAFQFIYPPANPRARSEDPNTCYSLLRIPQGKEFAVRVGPLSPGGYGNPHGYKAAYTLKVDELYPTLVYRFAFVQQFDHGSSSGDDPMGFGGMPSGAGNNAAMWVQALDEDGGQVAGACGNYRLYPGAASGVEWFEWQQCGEISSTLWMTDVIDLGPYAGQEITLEFNTMDCYTGHHMAYAYISPESFPQDTVSWYCPGTAAVITGPFGFKSYEWEEVDKQGFPVPDGLKLTKYNADQIGTDTEGVNQLEISEPVAFSRYSCTFTSYSGCSGKIIYEIHPDSVYADFVWTNSEDGCRKTVFEDRSYAALAWKTSVAAWEWSFGDEASGVLNTSELQNASHSFSGVGGYEVSLVVISSSGCRDSVTENILVENDPLTVTADFSAVPNSCFIEFTDLSGAAGGDLIADWEWRFGDDSTSAEQHPRHVYQSAGIYDVTLIVTSSSGCSNAVQKPVEIFPAMLDYVKADFDFAVTDCNYLVLNDKTRASEQTLVSWLWTLEDREKGTMLSSNDRRPAFYLEHGGDYPVTLSVSTDLGCYKVFSRTLDVYIPEAFFDIDDACEGKVIPFAAKEQPGALKYSWDFGDGKKVENQKDINHIFPQAGTVTSYDIMLSVQTAGQCTYSLSKPIVVHPAPEAGFSYDNSSAGRFRPVLFRDESVGASRWIWIMGDGTVQRNSDAENKDISHIYAGPGEQYIVTQIVYNVAGCADTLHQTIYLNQGIVAANAFSPNGDGNNDVFRLVHRGIDQLYDFRIYNRWGEQVFATSDLYDGWDGTYNGKAQPQGAYVYYVKARTEEGEEISLTGNVNLIR